MIWTCFAATGTGHPLVSESTMSSSVYQIVLESDFQNNYPIITIITRSIYSHVKSKGHSLFMITFDIFTDIQT